ncbi:ribosomal large subunit pseudouridine synthase C [Spiroplasma helicoides]|uniref:RNA pseudouridylate synthase n=1 Tax=Spiroplasma helicoides TaxID=216938 RepID=A0A1B3SJH5_9MOLU|nr:RluA family pseudouridine synthase [Spiroplasma helicoides]AOG60071.1 ribosomal large subunit pseudouridine synthase C [Spiroplasma helicoides]
MTLFEINKNDENQTIFNYIKKNFKNTSLSIIYKWFRTGKVKLNDKKVKDLKTILNNGDLVRVFDTSTPVKRVVDTNSDFSKLVIIYEDENILIVDKDSNVEMHSNFNDCLDSMVRSYLISTKQYDIDSETSFVVSHIHRLDKLTQGLVIYAKNKKTLDTLLTAIQDKDLIEKYYLAKLEENTIKLGQIDGFINYDSEDKKAKFSVKEVKRYKNCSQIHKWFDEKSNILEIRLLTGRKHQIRAICEFYKCPILSDFRYGAKRTTKKSIALIAYKLKFNNFTDHLSYLNDKEFMSKKTF